MGSGVEFVGPPVGAMDPAGNVMLLWYEQAVVGDPRPVYPPKFSRYDAAAGTWSVAAAPPGIPDSAGPAAVVANSAGNFIAVWSFGGHLSTSVFVKASGIWTAPQPLDTAPETAGNTRLAIDDNNVVTAAWNQSSKIWVSRRSPSTGAWSAPLALPTVTAHFPSEFPGLGADSAGNALVVWARTFGFDYARFDGQTGTWGPSQTIYNPGTGLFRYATMNVRPDGRAIASWSVIGSGTSYSTYNPTTKTWGSPAVVVAGSGGRAYGLASYKNSNILGVNTTSSPGAQAAWFDFAIGTWSSPTTLFTGVIGGVHSPSQAVAGDGSAMVVANAGSSVRATRYDPKAAVWEPSASVGLAYARDAIGIWMDATGGAVIAWVQDGATTSIEHMAVTRYTKYR
jgi:hypothetical protein